MPTYLDRILEYTYGRVAEEKRRRSFGDLDRAASAAPPPRPFLAAMRGERISLIAEFKRKSPSKGEIRGDFEPAQAAEAYQQGGASAMSVLTEPEFFDGSLNDLQAARAACRLPVLRKDFTVDPYQVVQARAAGADAILLIVAALPDAGLFKELAAAAEEYGLATLVEIHDPHELDAAFAVEPRLVGVNQRDLTTFDVDTGLAVKLRREIPREVAMVAESGITSRRQVEELEKAEVDAILVGETLMRAADPSAAAAELLGAQVD
ncbi:MAG TPA: indole-3-glycerol phosphate synthase TrpC [Actinomycetota bacterium]|nr:indole-3-glycerol phosphate synthase TrpC [Actinomycetota bacterium]